MYACIPAFNEEENIGHVLLVTRKLVDQVFVCDDGSKDMTRDLAESLGAFVVRHDRNMGKGVALRDLFMEALKGTPDAVVVLDCDGQHDPNFIPDVVKPILSGEADMVVGSRYIEGSKTDAPLYRRIGLRFFNWNRGNGGVKDVQSGFRAYTAEALRSLSLTDANGFGVEMEQVGIAEKKGMRIVEVPIEVRYDVKKPSKKNPLLHGSDLIMTLIRIAVEERPLLLLGLPGIIFFAMGTFSGAMLVITLDNFNYFSLPYAMLMLLGVSLGGMLGVAAMILYAISKLKPKP